MNYDDIINLEHYEPKNHPRMSIYNRSAQFAPFAALTGYDEEVKETARRTERKIELSEEELKYINNTLNELKKDIRNRPLVEVVYFIPDSYKSGGKYEKIIGNIRRIDVENKVIKFVDNKEIKINDLFTIKRFVN